MRQKIQFLTKEEIIEINYCALELLEQTGVIIKNLTAQKILKKGSVDVDPKKGLVKISSEIVKESLKKTPKSVIIYDRNGRRSLVLEKDNVYFNPGSTAINFLEGNGVLRRPVSKDLKNYVKLVDELPYIHAQITSLVISDVLSEVADRYRLLAVEPLSQQEPR